MVSLDRGLLLNSFCVVCSCRLYLDTVLPAKFSRDADEIFSRVPRQLTSCAFLTPLVIHCRLPRKRTTSAHGAPSAVAGFGCLRLPRPAQDSTSDRPGGDEREDHPCRERGAREHPPVPCREYRCWRQCSCARLHRAASDVQFGPDGYRALCVGQACDGEGRKRGAAAGEARQALVQRRKGAGGSAPSHLCTPAYSVTLHLCTTARLRLCRSLVK